MGSTPILTPDPSDSEQAGELLGPRDLSERPLRVVLLGNPNSGKSTLFNRLTGIHQQTANYPRVTFEHHIGRFTVAGQSIELIDLPGTYGLTPRSPEEIISINVLLGERPIEREPDVILCMVDANNLERSLFLVSQILDLQRPTVLAVNMLDVARRNGVSVDLEQLSRQLGIPVVGLEAHRGIGLNELKDQLKKVVDQPPKTNHNPFPDSWNQRISQLAESIGQQSVAMERAASTDSSPHSAQSVLDSDNGQPNHRFAAIRLLFDTEGLLDQQYLHRQQDQILGSLNTIRQSLERDGVSLAEAESELRCQWINRCLEKVVKSNSTEGSTADSNVSLRIDRWLTHPVFGLLVALIVMVMVFQGVFGIAEPANELIESLKALLAGGINAVLAEGPLNSLLIDGFIGGVGAVLVFLPQILLLFLFLAILEDSGYLARAAFLMDRYLSRLGLSGITLFPLLSSFACAIPGILSSRVIANPKERMITILIAPLMSCSARLPVYILFIAVFIPDQRYLFSLLGLQGLVMMGMYLLGIVVAVGVAWVLKQTWFKTAGSSFVMELPEYKWPVPRNVVRRMFDGGWAFVRDAGTIIVAVTILVWAASYFPRVDELPIDLQAQQSEMRADQDRLVQLKNEAPLLPTEPTEQASAAVGDQLASATTDGGDREREIEAAIEQIQLRIDGIESSYQLRQSYLGRAGHWIEPAIKPLGWDWRIGCAVIASFPAREVVVATLGVIFGQGADQNEESTSLRSAIEQATWDGSDQKLFNIPVALSLMVFFALCAQCVSTLAVIKRETNSWRWPLFTFTYMTVLAYLAALVTYQLLIRLMG